MSWSQLFRKVESGNPMFCYPGTDNKCYFCFNFSKKIGLNHTYPDTNVSILPNPDFQGSTVAHISQCKLLYYVKNQR